VKEKRDPTHRSPAHDSAADRRPEVSAYFLERLLREAYLDSGVLELPADISLSNLRDAWEAKRRASVRDVPREQAQELAYQALESEDADRAAHLAQAALEIDPDCVDALAVMALVTAEDPEDLLAQLQHAVQVAEDELSEEFFAEFMGDFHAEVIVRPYLRVLRQLAAAQWGAGRRFDAVATYELLLELDQKDHLSAATELLACYLEMGEVFRARETLALYGDEEDALDCWAGVLTAFLEGAGKEAETALERARERNLAAEAYLSGARGTPTTPEPWFEPGSEREAVVIGQVLGAAWAAHAEARRWLREATGETGEEPDGGADAGAGADRAADQDGT
jgi:tetratricopeptide (TPR) repeat protein